MEPGWCTSRALWVIPTELQATDLLSYVDVPGAIDLHHTYRGVWHIISLWGEDVAETKIQISEYISIPKTMNNYYCNIGVFLIVSMYNRKWDSLFYNSVDLHVKFSPLYFLTDMSIYISPWPWLVRIIPDQQIPLWFIIISVKSAPHSIYVI